MKSSEAIDMLNSTLPVNFQTTTAVISVPIVRQEIVFKMVRSLVSLANA
jgi:hypothetical protein